MALVQNRWHILAVDLEKASTKDEAFHLKVEVIQQEIDPMNSVTGNIHRSSAGFDLAPPSAAQRQELESTLTKDERQVLLKHGTEAAFCGGLLGNKEVGTYCCRLCGLPLFSAARKFDSGTGWPSFTAPFAADHLNAVSDISYGMTRTEIRCARCDSHQGHVFPDGPKPSGQRYCINSVSLEFTPRGQDLPDKLQRGDAPEGASVRTSG